MRKSRLLFLTTAVAASVAMSCTGCGNEEESKKAEESEQTVQLGNLNFTYDENTVDVTTDTSDEGTMLSFCPNGEQYLSAVAYMTSNSFDVQSLDDLKNLDQGKTLTNPVYQETQNSYTATYYTTAEFDDGSTCPIFMIEVYEKDNTATGADSTAMSSGNTDTGNTEATNDASTDGDSSSKTGSTESTENPEVEASEVIESATETTEESSSAVSEASGTIDDSAIMYAIGIPYYTMSDGTEVFIDSNLFNDIIDAVDAHISGNLQDGNYESVKSVLTTMQAQAATESSTKSDTEATVSDTEAANLKESGFEVTITPEDDAASGSASTEPISNGATQN